MTLLELLVVLLLLGVSAAVVIPSLPRAATRERSLDHRADPDPVMVVTIDAMGSCVAAGTRSAGRRFDPLACAWPPEAARTSASNPDLASPRP